MAASQKKQNRKYIFVVGGVISGVGKGITTSSIASLLQGRGYKVTAMKIDPYLNVDAGTMNPTEHGEVFVLDDGYETDQDMGNYERFLNTTLSRDNYMTSGMVYRDVINRERNLGYGGKCVEAVPHVRDEIISRFERAAETADADITIIEIGGTVGDFQNALFIDAARIIHMKRPDNVAFVMVTYLPVPGTLGEMKTKPTQNAVRDLNSYGVQPDIIIARGPVPLDHRRKEKIAQQCSIDPKNVISAPDVSSIYDVPLNFEHDNLSASLLTHLNLKPKKKTNLAAWRKFAHKAHNGGTEVKIGIVGKYFGSGDFVLSDAYLSVIEALKYSAYAANAKPVLTWLNASDYQNGKNTKELAKYDGILVPGGFGESGIDGKIHAIKFARENKIPYFGLCYGMQLLVIEYARNVVGLSGANTAEIDPNAKHPIVDIMPEQKALLANKDYGGSMRLGAYPAILKKGTIAFDAYKQHKISERHRHRYEVNPEYVQQIEEKGLVFSGTSPDGILMEIAELPRDKHPFFLGTQFHPEFLARPLAPHPLFDAFIRAARAHRGKK